MFKTAAQITKQFIADGWAPCTKFRLLTQKEAKERGLTFALNSGNRKFFVMESTGNVYSDTGKVVYYNI